MASGASRMWNDWKHPHCVTFSCYPSLPSHRQNNFIAVNANEKPEGMTAEMSTR